MRACAHCNEAIDSKAEAHAAEGYGHEELCCDCFDLSCGKPRELINERRAERGKAPIQEMREEPKP